LVEKDIGKLFPEARLARADRDEIQSREDLEDLIEKFEKRELDVLIGTQMIAKGLDFPGLNLVGLVLADVGFHWPDFRASERSFQLLTQVSGRSGRHTSDPGKVIIQTYNPEHPAIEYTVRHDIVGFLNSELETRKELAYPPFSRLAMIRIQGATIARAESATKMLLRRGEALKAERPSYRETVLLGPAPAPLSKLRGKFRFHMLIKSGSPSVLNHFCQELIGDETWLPTGIQCAVDINPVSML
jgi:primosomal protein N' (replication factor Y)